MNPFQSTGKEDQEWEGTFANHQDKYSVWHYANKTGCLIFAREISNRKAV